MLHRSIWHRPFQRSLEEWVPTVLTSAGDPTILDQVDLFGINRWEQKNQQAAQNLLVKYSDVFSQNDMDLGEMSLVEHEIKLQLWSVPFCKRYLPIPLSLYEEVHQHVKEMLEIGAICLSSSPWALVVVWVRKKDGKLRFCIDLLKLNSMNIKDVYSLLWIQETLECLKGHVWLMSLDLKSGNWQVCMSEASKALTAFTVNPLGFYDCEYIPFSLTNAPVVFQFSWSLA